MERIKNVQSVMVTGSHGFVGRKLVNKLKDYDVEVISVDIKDGIDILNFESFFDLKKVDVVVHLAAKTFVPDAFANPAEIYKSNIIGTINVLEYCRLKSVKKIIYTSSYVYGTPEYLPVDEEHKTNIQNPYGRSKLIGEMICMGYFKDYGILPVIFRPFNIFGAGQTENFLIPSVIKQTLSNDKTITVRDSSPKRDYIYIDDVIDVYMYAIFNYVGNSPEVFNVGYGKSFSVKQIIDKIQKIAATDKSVVVTGESRKNEILDSVADITKLKKHFNWIPRYSIEEGLNQTLLLDKNDV